MKLYSSLDSYSGYPFNVLWPDVESVYLPEDLEREPGILVLWGGEDISPSIYGEKCSKLTGACDRPSSKDKLEISLVQRAVELNYPIIAICRGAQLVCALLGGKVIQHVEGHGRTHAITTIDGREYLATSLHHQMMNLSSLKKEEYELIAWSKQSLSPCYIGENDINIIDIPEKEPEIVYFPTFRCLAIQGHPEFIPSLKNPYVQYCLELTNKLCTF